MRISDWSSDVFSSDLTDLPPDEECATHEGPNDTIVVCASPSDKFKKGNKWRETSLGGMARPRGQGSMPTGGNGGGKSTPQNDKACAALNKRVEDARNYLTPRLTNTSAWYNPKLLKAYQDNYRSNAEEWDALTSKTIQSIILGLSSIPAVDRKSVVKGKR